MSVRTLRWGPLEGWGSWTDKAQFTPGEIGEDGMPVGTYEDIPDDTSVIIEILPGRRMIFNKKAAHSISLDLDPGKYGYSMKKNLPIPEDEPGAKHRCITASGIFYVDVNEEQWAKLRDMKAKNVAGRMTADGPIFKCLICDKQTRTRMAAFLHESREHFNIDPIADPMKAKHLDSGLIVPKMVVPETASLAASMKKTAKKRRARGAAAGG